MVERTRPVAIEELDLDGIRILPPDDRDLANVLVRAASGVDVEAEIIRLLAARA